MKGFHIMKTVNDSEDQSGGLNPPNVRHVAMSDAREQLTLIVERAHHNIEITIIDKNGQEKAGVVSHAAAAVVKALQALIPDLSGLAKHAHNLDDFRAELKRLLDERERRESA